MRQEEHPRFTKPDMTYHSLALSFFAGDLSDCCPWETDQPSQILHSSIEAETRPNPIPASANLAYTFVLIRLFLLCFVFVFQIHSLISFYTWKHINTGMMSRHYASGWSIQPAECYIPEPPRSPRRLDICEMSRASQSVKDEQEKKPLEAEGHEECGKAAAFPPCNPLHLLKCGGTQVRSER